MAILSGNIYEHSAYNWEKHYYEFKFNPKYYVKGNTYVFVFGIHQISYLEEFKALNCWDVHYISPKAHNRNYPTRRKDIGNIVVIATFLGETK